MAVDPNSAEWANPANWHGGIFRIYQSEKDSRVWVPKRNPAMGWTLNFAHRAAWLWLAGLVLGPIVVIVIATILLKGH